MGEMEGMGNRGWGGDWELVSVGAETVESGGPGDLIRGPIMNMTVSHAQVGVCTHHCSKTQTHAHESFWTSS